MGTRARPVPSELLPILSDIVPHRAVTAVWFGSFDGVAAVQVAGLVCSN
jgi:hypothetical protein